MNIQTATWETKNTVIARCGGHGQECVGQTVSAKSKSGSKKYVKLVELVEDYGQGDVAEFRVEFV